MPDLLSIHLGQVQAFGPRGEPSAIRKLQVSGRASIARLGLAGDAQADPRHHGGPEKALHHYPREHYAAWRAELPERAAEFVPGGFGENLSTLGLTEAEVCIGDVFRLGSALIQVSQGRTPCWKLNRRFGVADMLRRVADSGRSGWYYRVLEPGAAGAGDAFTRVERPHPDWPLDRLLAVLHGDPPDRTALAALADLPALAEGWRAKAVARLGTSE